MLIKCLKHPQLILFYWNEQQGIFFQKKVLVANILLKNRWGYVSNSHLKNKQRNKKKQWHLG